MLNRTKWNRNTGQGIAEYSLVGTLIALAVIAPFTLLGKNTTTAFKGLNTKTQQQTIAKTANNTTLLNSISAPALPNMSNVGIGLSDGTQLQLNNYPAKVDSLVQTSGANGTSELLLSDLDSLIQQLSASGEITPSDASLLQQLSNQGHQMAGIEGLIEDAATKSNGQTSGFLSQVITYNGKTYKTNDLAKLIGVGNPKFIDASPPPITFDGVTFNAGSEVAQFFSLLTKVNQLNLDPTVLETVNILSKQISDVANIVQSGVNDVSMNNSPIADYVKNGIYWTSSEDPMPNTADDLSGLASSVVTSTNAATICNMDGSTDTGQQCQ